jgi:hypothetical protein
LALPGIRSLLLDQIGSGRVDFIYDNEAFTFGRVLIEHGNRFDEWNAVPHGSLRRGRSQLSRGLPVKPAFPELPGSRLVVDVMNGLKRQYAFVDLLKRKTPELSQSWQHWVREGSARSGSSSNKQAGSEGPTLIG